MEQESLNAEVPATQPPEWLRRDPITGRLLCGSCWNGIHFIYEKKWDEEDKKFKKSKKRACLCNSCECLCTFCS